MIPFKKKKLSLKILKEIFYFLIYIKKSGTLEKSIFYKEKSEIISVLKNFVNDSKSIIVI
jgi:hypothetical protein